MKAPGALQNFNTGSEALAAYSTGCPYYDLLNPEISNLRLINLISNSNDDVAESAIDAVRERVKSNLLTAEEYRTLDSQLMRLADSRRLQPPKRVEAALQDLGETILSRRSEKLVLPRPPLAKAENTCYRLDIFDRTGTADRPVYIAGSEDGAAIFGLSGVHCSANPLLREMHKLVRYTGIPAGVYALDSHTSDPQTYRHATSESMVRSARRDLNSLIHILEVERCCAVGFSLGALVLLSIAVDHPGSIEKLVLINPPLVISNREILRTFDEIDAGQTRWAKVHKPTHKSERSVRKNPSIISSPLEPFQAFRELYEGAFSRLQQLMIPTLIILSAEDKVADSLQIEEILRKIHNPNISSLTISGGHMSLMTDSGKNIAATIKKFMAGY